jgi:hypothetical protein
VILDASIPPIYSRRVEGVPRTYPYILAGFLAMVSASVLSERDTIMILKFESVFRGKKQEKVIFPRMAECFVKKYLI